MDSVLPTCPAQGWGGEVLGSSWLEPPSRPETLPLPEPALHLAGRESDQKSQAPSLGSSISATAGALGCRVAASGQTRVTRGKAAQWWPLQALPEGSHHRCLPAGHVLRAPGLALLMSLPGVNTAVSVGTRFLLQHFEKRGQLAGQTEQGSKSQVLVERELEAV